jgi:hypothetical protein
MTRRPRPGRDTSSEMPADVHGALTAAKQLVRSLDGISAVDYGIAYKNGKPTDRLAVRFHVGRKKPVRELKAHQRVPRSIADLPVDVLATGYRLHAAGPKSVNDVLRPGISVGSLRSKTTGTLGALVRDNDSGSLCILSNWHVLCGDTDAAAGDKISQPGPMDLGSNPAREVALLERWCRLSEQIDAAVARLDPGSATALQLFGTDIRPTGVVAPAVGMRVLKSGAVTNVTRAIVDGIGGSYQMDYSQFGDEQRWIAGFRLVPDPAFPSSALSLEGDSGSLWVEADSQRAVGLHFAGEDDESPLNDYALAQPIENVLAKLGVSLATA